MIQKLTVGMLQEHTYFFIDEVTKHGFLVDPGDEAERILNKIKQEEWVIEKILLTHGHFDHIGAVAKIKTSLGCLVVIHEEGKDYLHNPEWNLSGRYGEAYTVDADYYVKHGDVITLEANSNMNLKVIHAPGHTTDGTAYYSEKEHIAFVGDIIFNGAVGRCDNPGGNMNRLLSAIRAQIFTLPDATILYPGHGPYTTVKHEKDTNPFFNFYE
ncbi:MBL fold metallo-hydrolase [Cellulosilyticum sp. I15G10I2]|uniref:MBL fold metallo-hydrolase n=1 Tax=Cellulosilyticum sp. I15G10I2 TaxID=1892843 RepID=UPI00085BC7E5|nr:MBL fold metallo-hydrolase [Cellulosilyticum sp. I15G10I2]